MQNLRFRRYASVFKACHDLSLNVIDMYHVFYEKSINMFVGPQLRRDFMQCCYPDYFSTPAKIP